LARLLFIASRMTSSRTLSPALSAVFLSLASPLLGQDAKAASAALPQGAEAPKKAAEPKPWRLNSALGGPSWLTVSGEQRSRYETLNHQFRSAANGNDLYAGQDDVLALRTSVRIDAKGDTLGGTVEILDSRQYGMQTDSFVDTTMVNTSDVLQAFGSAQLGELGDGKHELRVGREAIDLGNRRLVARNAFRNTINAFDGADWLWSSKDVSARAFWLMPVERRPSDNDALRNNEFEFDNQDLDTQFAGFYGTKKWNDTDGVDVYVLGLDENGAGTRMRELVTIGSRLFGNCAVNNQPIQRDGAWFYEVEATSQFGESKTNTQPSTPISDHEAWFLHASLGYAFDAPWKPAVQVAYDYASGDRSNTDGKNNRFDTLYGARRWEYGPTGIWGAIARANLDSPELRLLLQPASDVNFMVAVRGVWLAEERDAWTAGGLRDATGASGTHVGEQIEARIRWDVLPKSFDIEVGFATLLEGSFQDRASGGQGEDATYGYLQTTFRF
jgi:hypothetical protein